MNLFATMMNNISSGIIISISLIIVLFIIMQTVAEGCRGQA